MTDFKPAVYHGGIQMTITNILTLTEQTVTGGGADNYVDCVTSPLRHSRPNYICLFHVSVHDNGF